jgi:hypothetical protein
VQIRPEDLTVDALGGVEHVVVVVPVDAQEHIAENVREEDGHNRRQHADRVAVRDLQVQDHDGDEDRHHASLNASSRVLLMFGALVAGPNRRR